MFKNIIFVLLLGCSGEEALFESDNFLNNNLENKNIIVEFDAKMINANNFHVIENLSEMFEDSAEIGDMEYDIFKFNIQSLETYEKDLIIRK